MIIIIPPLESNNAYSAPSSSTESDKSNVSLPSDKSRSAQNAVLNVENNIPDTTDTNSDCKIYVYNILDVHVRVALE